MESVRRNLLLNAAGEGLWGFHAGLISTATVLVVLLTRFGASAKMIGALTAVQTIALLLPQILGNYLFASRVRRKRQLVLWHLFLIIPFTFVIGGICLSSHLSAAQTVRWGILLAYALGLMFIGVIVPAWHEWVAGIFPVQRRGRAWGIALGVASLMSAAGTIIAGLCLGESPRMETFAYLYFVGGGFAVLSMVVFWQVADPAERRPDTPALKTRELMTRFRESLSQSNFRRFLIGRVLAMCGFCIIPFIAYHYQSVSGGGVSDREVISLGAGLAVGGAFGNFVFGRIGDHHGHRIGLIAGAVGQVVTLVVLLTLPGRLGCALAFLSAGLCTGIGWLSQSNLIFETCPHGHLSSHITVSNLLLGLGTSLAAIGAGWIADAYDVRVLFIISLIVSVIAVFWFTTMVAEPRKLAMSSGRSS